MERISRLIQARLRGDLSPDETAELDVWAAGSNERKELLDRLDDDETILADLSKYAEWWSGALGERRFQTLGQRYIPTILAAGEHTQAPARKMSV